MSVLNARRNLDRKGPIVHLNPLFSTQYGFLKRNCQLCSQVAAALLPETGGIVPTEYISEYISKVPKDLAPKDISKIGENVLKIGVPLKSGVMDSRVPTYIVDLPLLGIR